MDLASAKMIGAGLAGIGVGAAAIGVGIVFGQFLNSGEARANFLRQIDSFLAANPNYRGLSLDLEEIPDNAQSGFNALVAAIYKDFQARKLRLYVNVPVSVGQAENSNQP